MTARFNGGTSVRIYSLAPYCTMQELAPIFPIRSLEMPCATSTLIYP